MAHCSDYRHLAAELRSCANNAMCKERREAILLVADDFDSIADEMSKRVAHDFYGAGQSADVGCARKS
jgi:hypothetical protein